MHQLVDDDELAQGHREVEGFGAAGQAASSGDGGPFSAQGAGVDLADLDLDPCGPA